MMQPNTAKQQYVVNSLSRYWPNHNDVILKLPIKPVENSVVNQHPATWNLVAIRLPDWAAEWGVEGNILVPSYLVTENSHHDWSSIDWFAVMFWYLHAVAERDFEKKHKIIHSYSNRLSQADKRMWQYAWVNRIALFLRRWAAREMGQDERQLFGELPASDIRLTHDVDAIHKTKAIRAKQFAFHMFNFQRSIRAGNWTAAFDRFATAWRFLLSHDDYWCFDTLMRMEEEAGVRSVFNIYGGLGGKRRTLKQKVFDPSYRVGEQRLTSMITTLADNGWDIGLHQSFNSWFDAEAMRIEKQSLEEVLKREVTICRQHWLRFSWEHTWQAQEQAGFTCDMTLAFNNHPGFRNGSAVEFHPWDEHAQQEKKISVMPTVFMDSHFYDYQSYNKIERQHAMDYWLEEVKFVHGVASVVWHQRVFAKDYGWQAGYQHVLEKLIKHKHAN